MKTDALNFAALVPIKEASQRLPKKNFLKFCGKPLYHYILETLCKVSQIREVIVDTDSAEILDCAPNISSKIKAIPRKRDLCGDYAPFLDILHYDMSKSKCDHFIQSHVTNPLLTVETVESGIEFYSTHWRTCGSVFSAVPIRSRLYKGGHAINHDPLDRLLRTQDLEEVYKENSNFYIFSRENMSKENHRIGSRSLPFMMKELESVDIDNKEDFILAELLYQNFQHGGK